MIQFSVSLALPPSPGRRAGRADFRDRPGPRDLPKGPFKLLDQLNVRENFHAFHVGQEMSKAAATQLTAGKTHTQNEAFSRGFLTGEVENLCRLFR